MHAGEEGKEDAQVRLDLGELSARGGIKGKCRRLGASADKYLQFEAPVVEGGGGVGEVHVLAVFPQLHEQPPHKALGHPGHAQHKLAGGKLRGRKHACVELVVLRRGQQRGRQQLLAV